MNWNLLNQLIRVWERVKGDIPARLALGLTSLGITLLGGSGAVYYASLSYTTTGGATVKLEFSLGDICFIVALIGGLFALSGFIMILRRFRSLEKVASTRDTALFFFAGFPNMNDQIPISSIPKNIQPKVTAFPMGKMDSYDPKKIVEKYPFYAQTIKERTLHSGYSSAFVAALGSIPYLYLIGAMFRNGNIHLRTLEHDRKEDKWNTLEDVGEQKHLLCQLSEITDRSKILDVVEHACWSDTGLAISLTNQIQSTELPDFIRDQTISLKLNSEFEYNALPCEPVQDEIIEQIAHLLTSISKYTSHIHLFVCAQASFVIKLGRLYQDSMMGEVVIHNYDASSKSYNWALRFDGYLPVVASCGIISQTH